MGVRLRKKELIGLFLISVATLALEISLIRLFSIMQWYHFAFMIVSIAMFGMAAAGTYLSIKKLKKPLGTASVLFTISTIVGFFIVNKLSFDPFKVLITFSEIFKLLLYYIFLGLPFFFFGIIVVYMLSKHPQQSGKIYFYNLFGSGIGSLLALLLISMFGPKLIFAIAFIGSLSALCFVKKLKSALILIIVVLILFAVPFDINISKYKELNQALNIPNSKHLLREYNSFSRVDVVNSSFTRYAPGLSAQFRGELPEQFGVLVDAGSMNAITHYDNLSFIDYLPTAVAFSLIKNPDTIIINSGAGLDVLTALKYNSTVTAVESNPIVVRLLKKTYKDFSGDIYSKAGVKIGEGRNVIRSGEKYDIIIISLAGNVLSSAAGVTSLSENYLLTVEAFKDYYNHLTDNGVLVITRWLLYPPRESLRLFSIALEAGIPEDNIAMFRSWTTTTILISKNELSNERINQINGFTAKNRFDLIYLPANFTPNKYAKFDEPFYFNAINSILSDREEFYKSYVFDVSPVYDDKPFYFNFFSWKKLPDLYKAIGNKWQPFFDSGFLLLIIFVQALVLSLIFILLPITVSKKTKLKKRPLGYFFCIGISYLFIEIVFIQKLIMFLGHAVYAAAVVIFSMLLFSALGSLISQRLKINKLKFILIVLFVLAIVYKFLLSDILTRLISSNFLLNTIISIIIIAPIAFVMGFPFPLGIRAIQKKLIPWAWAVNGCASVLSAILAILIALSVGYSLVIMLAGLMYLIGLFFISPRKI